MELKLEIVFTNAGRFEIKIYIYVRNKTRLGEFPCILRSDNNSNRIVYANNCRKLKKKKVIILLTKWVGPKFSVYEMKS